MQANHTLAKYNFPFMDENENERSSYKFALYLALTSIGKCVKKLTNRQCNMKKSANRGGDTLRRGRLSIDLNLPIKK